MSAPEFFDVARVLTKYGDRLSPGAHAELAEMLAATPAQATPAAGDALRAIRDVAAEWRAGMVDDEEAMTKVDALTIAAPRHEVVQEAFTTGHCENKKKPGGCPLHNLHCGWPKCDQRPAAPPPAQAGDTERGEACQEHGTAVVESLTLYGCSCSVHVTTGGRNVIKHPFTPPTEASAAQAGEAVAEVHAGAFGTRYITTLVPPAELLPGTKLYTRTDAGGADSARLDWLSSFDGGQTTMIRLGQEKRKFLLWGECSNVHPTLREAIDAAREAAQTTREAGE